MYAHGTWYYLNKKMQKENYMGRWSNTNSVTRYSVLTWWNTFIRLETIQIRIQVRFIRKIVYVQHDRSSKFQIIKNICNRIFCKKNDHICTSSEVNHSELRWYRHTLSVMFDNNEQNYRNKQVKYIGVFCNTKPAINKIIFNKRC